MIDFSFVRRCVYTAAGSTVRQVKYGLKLEEHKSWKNKLTRAFGRICQQGRSPGEKMVYNPVMSPRAI